MKFPITPEELSSDKRFSSRRDEIEAIAQSDYGHNVKSMLDGCDFEQAFQNGDIDTVRSALADVMKTDDGKTLLRSLSELMGK